MIYDSPVGALEIEAGNRGIVMIDWVNNPKGRKLRARLEPLIVRTGCDRLIETAIAQLDEYFHARRYELNFPIQPVGTAFQMQVWEALKDIQYGTTKTYSEVALSIGRSTSCRAVANAIGRNPLNIIVPCHRVVAAKGVGGYAGGHDAKMFLLKMERPTGR